MATASGPVNLAYAIVALAVVVIVIASVALPVIESMQTEIKTTGQNSTQLYAMSNGSTATVTIEYDGDSSSVVINGYSILASTLGDRSSVLAICDSFFVDYYGTSPHLRVYSEDGLVTTGSITISGGVLSCVNSYDSSDVSIDVVGSVLYAAETGDYGDYYSSNPIYVNETSTIYTVYRNAIFPPSGVTGDPASYTLIALAKGSLKDGLTALVAVDQGSTVDVESTTVGITEVSDGNGYKIINPSSHFGGTGYEVEYVTDTSAGDYERILNQPIIAPIEYTYISSSDDSMINLLGIIPVLLILVPIMMAVGLMRGKS